MTCVLSHFSHVWLFATLWTVTHEVLLSIGFSRQENEWVAMPSSKGSSWPRNWSGLSCIAGGFFTNWAIREALIKYPGRIQILVSSQLSQRYLSTYFATGWYVIKLSQPNSSPSNSVQFSSVTQSCLTLCDPMNHSTPSLPVHHQLPEFTQTHVHRVSDAIQPSHPLLSPSPPAPNPSQHQGLFQWVHSSHEVAKALELQLQHQSFQWTPRIHLL